MARITKADIKQGLREVGIKPGDLVVVHSSLSSFGYVEGRADVDFTGGQAFVEGVDRFGHRNSGVKIRGSGRLLEVYSLCGGPPVVGSGFESPPEAVVDHEAVSYICSPSSVVERERGGKGGRPRR